MFSAFAAQKQSWNFGIYEKGLIFLLVVLVIVAGDATRSAHSHSKGGTYDRFPHYKSTPFPDIYKGKKSFFSPKNADTEHKKITLFQ